MRAVQNVYQGALQAGDPDGHSRPLPVQHLEMLLCEAAQRLREPGALEDVGTECQLLHGARCRVDDLVPDRIGPPVELQGRVVGQHGVPGQLGGHQVRVHRVGIAIGSRRDDGEQPTPHPHQASRLGVVGYEGLLRPLPRLAVGGEMFSQFLPGEHGMAAEEGFVFDGRHD